MTYGTIKVDTVTFTNDGVDKSVTLSGLVQNPTFSGNVTVTGTLSGVTVTGTTANFTSGNFTNISGGTHTITSGVFAAGSAASPSITFTGDLNTGIYSPGADQVAISTGGSGRLFVDASGRVGIGASGPGFPLEVRATSSTGQVQILGSDNTNATWRLATPSNSVVAFGGALAHAVAFGGFDNTTQAFSERLRITSAGLVGIGTSSPGYLLDVVSAGASDIRVKSGGAGSAYLRLGTATRDHAIYSDASTGSLVAYDITSATTRLVIDSSGRVGIGTSSPGRNLHVVGSSATALIESTGSTNADLLIGDGGVRYYGIRGVAGGGSLQIRNDTANTTLATFTSTGLVGIGTTSPSATLQVSPSSGSANFQVSRGSKGLQINQDNDSVDPNINTIGATALRFLRDGGESMRIDTSGRLLVGTSSARSNFFNSTITADLQVESTNGIASIIRDTAAAGGPALILGKTRSASVGGTTIVQNGDLIGAVSFQSSDGSTFIVAASVEAYVDGTPGAIDMPGRLVFFTTADGASSPTERLRITSAGLVGVGTSSPSYRLHAVAASEQTNPESDSGAYWPLLNSSSTLNTCSALALGTNNDIGTAIVAQRVGANNEHVIKFQTRNSSGSLGTRMTLTGPGSLGIGTTSPSQLLHIQGASNPAFLSLDTRNNVNAYMFAGNTEAVFGAGSAHPVTFRVTDLERARIDTSGRLLVGTSSTSSASALVVQNNSSGNGVGVVRINYSTDSPGANDTLGIVSFGDNTHGEYASVAGLRDGGTWSGSSKPTRLVFSTTADGASSPTERMRITSAGKILYNTATAAANTAITITAFDNSVGGAAVELNGWGNGRGHAIQFTAHNTANADVVYFNTSAATVGSISITSTATAYNTSSDYRLKENIVPVIDGIIRLQQLKPSRFNFLTDPSKVVDGFIAHEVQSVVPEAVTGTKDEISPDGTPKYQGIDQSKLVPLLTAALQEAVAKIESLEARLTAAGI